VENPNVALGGGAGIQSAQLMADRDVQVVLTGNCGPNAFRTLEAAGVQVIVGVSGSVREAAEQFKAEAFSATAEPNVTSHFGTGAGSPLSQVPPPQAGMGGGMGMGAGAGMGGGRGMGRGMGGGGGRGMGGGMGMGRGMAGGGRGIGRGMGAGMESAAPPAPYPPAPGMPPQAGAPVSPGQELQMLRAQAQALSDQLLAVQRRIDQMARGGASALLAVVDADRCTGCGLCQEVCPTGAVSVDKVARIDGSKCTGCGQCVAECPEDALSLRKA